LSFESIKLFIDILALGLIVFLIYQGYKKGVLESIFALIRLLIAFLATLMLYEKLSVAFQAGVSMSTWLAKLLCFSLIFIPLFIFLWFIGIFIQNKIPKSKEISNSSKFIGAIFGLLRGILIISIIFMVLDFYAAKDSDESLIGNIISYKITGKIAPGIEKLIFNTILHKPKYQR